MSLANKITLLRIFSIPLIVLILFAQDIPDKNLIAAGLFLLIALTDYLDGYVARKFDQITNFGKVFDPLADKLLIAVTLLCMVELKMVSSIPVMVIISREFLVSGIRIVAGSSGKIIAASKLGKWKTVFQDTAVLMLLAGVQYGVLILWTAVALTVISGIDYLMKSKEALSG